MEANDMPTIKALIRSALDGGRTVRQLEADSGQRVRFQTFQELSIHAPKQFPKHPETIAGMAAALGVSQTTIVLAYARGLGIPIVIASSFAMRLPPGMDDLEPDMQDALIGVARAALTSQSSARRLVGAVAEDERKKFPWGRRSADQVGGEDRRQHGQ